MQSYQIQISNFIRMELIGNQRYGLTTCPQHILLSRVKRALQLISTQVDLVKTEGNTSYFLVLLQEKKKAQYKLWTHWKITLKQSVQLQVTLSNQHQQFLPIDPTILIPEFISRLNRESILGNYFNFPQSPSIIHFRHSFPTEIHKKIVAATISQIFFQVSEQFSKWVTKLKMVRGDDKIKSNKMYNCLKKLRYMKQFFEIERLNKPKATKNYNLKNSSVKIVEEALRVVGYQPNLLLNYRVNQLDKNTNLLQIYKHEFENLTKLMVQKQKDYVPCPIMRGIEIKKTLNEKKFDEGGYSEIYRGQYIVVVTLTIYDFKNYPANIPKLPSPMVENTSGEIMHDSSESQVQSFSRRLLVKKVMKSCVKEINSFKNEINLLIYIRNDKEERIAGYYIQTHNDKQQLFMEYYEKNLAMACQEWNEKLLLNAVRQTIEGIAYLSGKNILHRDIKELNILIDSHNHIKLIDFGSACAVYQENPPSGSYSAINNDLLSTPTYYFPYAVISNEYPGIQKKFTRDQYNQASTFDVFSVGTIIRNLFHFSRHFDNIFYRQLDYLADKCHQKNPDDRITAKEAQCYIYLLTQLYRLENEQDKKMSSKSVSQSEESFRLSRQLFKQN